jgi:glycosyltransferase involved in cell wall biosynthesis
MPDSLRIAIDASRTTVTPVTGTERYSIELIRALIRRAYRHRVTLYFRDPPPPHLFPTFRNVEQRIIPLRRAWTHLRFAAEIRRDRPDVTFVPSHTLPLRFPGRAVVTVHDLGFRYFPEAHPPLQRRYLDWATRHSAQRADVVLADSQATADDLTAFYGIAPDKIRVVYPGVDRLPPGDPQAARRRYGLPDRYFLFVGTLQPRKNIARLAQAYASYRRRVLEASASGAPDQPHQPERTPAGLVLVGAKGWRFDEGWLRGADGEFIPGVHLTGYIDEADRGPIYSGALALVFPSLYEGFGFPVIEAMRCGTPVIASRTSSLPELVGDAGLLVDPLDADLIGATMTHLDEDAELRARLRHLGYAQAEGFTWTAAAAGALRAIEAAGGIGE